MTTTKTDIASTAKTAKNKRDRQTTQTLAEAIKAGDQKRIAEAVAELGLSDVHVQVIAAVIAEIPVLQKRIQQGRDAAATRDRLERQRAVARQIQPESVVEAGRLAEEIHSLEQDYSRVCRLAASTARAELELTGLHRRFPMLFTDPIPEGVGGPLPNAISNLCRSLNIDPKDPLSEPVDWMTEARRREYTPVVMRNQRRFSI